MFDIVCEFDFEFYGYVKNEVGLHMCVVTFQDVDYEVLRYLLVSQKGRGGIFGCGCILWMCMRIHIDVGMWAIRWWGCIL